jgi:hypothetical protein
MPRTAASGGGNAGAWLVVAGGLLVFAMSFVFWGAIWSSSEGVWSPRTWQFDVALWSWRGLWPPRFLSGHWWGTWRGWVGQVLYLAWMAMMALCVVASIQALRRGLGAPVNGGVLRAFGIAALAVFIVYEVYFATAPYWRTLYVTDLAAIIGAVLIIVGGSLMGTPPPRRYRSAPAPGWR